MKSKWWSQGHHIGVRKMTLAHKVGMRLSKLLKDKRN